MILPYEGLEDLLHVNTFQDLDVISSKDIEKAVSKLLALLHIASVLTANEERKKDVVNLLTPLTPRIAKLVEKTRKDEIHEKITEAIAAVGSLVDEADMIIEQIKQQLKQTDRGEYFVDLFEYEKWSNFYKTTYSVHCGLLIELVKNTVYQRTRKNSSKCKAEDKYILVARLVCRKK